ncbi:AraC family transcriptional regulator [Butyricicoccus sp. Marseille-Q5471]|uniref:AraC family transcriptional regulator n=1 Tax=Butyricicoccus sp. Marseille-Q5471 TaxID=3039493 RepID=UPI0024BD4A33|nr:AraC family transcriptional regulator [Butyricicoccus sp. Marseille-Q5471]
MHILEDGILEPSQIYFLMPSEFAMQTLYCLQHIGVFYCDARYVVTHPYWESILMLFIEEGELEVAVGSQLFTAHVGDVVIIDCREEHSYHAWDGLKFHYFHFAGTGSVDYIQRLYQLNHGALIQNAKSPMLENAFGNLLRLAQAQASMQNEHRISVYLHMILCELVETCSGIPPVTNVSIDKAIGYMEAHITQNISLDDLAQHVNLSKFYFTRYFRKHLGMTPHQYFVNMRIQYAKRLLATTHDSVESVAEQCGFDNVSNFIRVFKQRSGMTPTAFRKIPF